jgi:hypothetical protein
MGPRFCGFLRLLATSNRLLVDLLAPYGPPTGSVVYDSSGHWLSNAPFLNLGAIQIVGPDSLYDPAQNTIFSETTWTPTWTGKAPMLSTPDG